MQSDLDKIDNMVMAPPYLTSFEYGVAVRVRIVHDWDTLTRLYDNGMIANPRGEALSITLSDDCRATAIVICHRYSRADTATTTPQR